MNTPYVKQYSIKGVLLNPIIRNYLTYDSNRKVRRSDNKNPRPKYIQIIKSDNCQKVIKHFYKPN